jgi:hypothetical protein
MGSSVVFWYGNSLSAVYSHLMQPITCILVDWVGLLHQLQAKPAMDWVTLKPGDLHSGQHTAIASSNFEVAEAITCMRVGLYIALISVST